MEDYIIREIDRIGEMLMLVAKRLGLFLDDVKKEALLNDALAYLNGKGYFSFKLQSLKTN